MSIWTFQGNCQSVVESSQVGEVRRRMASIAREAGFSEEAAGAVAVVTTELGNNLVRHASGGELIFNRYTVSGQVRMLEIVALDRGPGMGDVQKCMRDGYSTGGTAGTGLGAARGMADLFDIHSVPDRGTVVVARFGNNPAAGSVPLPVSFGGISLPVRGEQACGDSWAVACEDGRTVLLVIDGLGHGKGAEEAAREAVRVFEEHAGASPVEQLQRMHGALRNTRGAAVALAEISPGGGDLRYAGIGNISATLIQEDSSRSLMSHNGTVGHEVRRVQDFRVPWDGASLLVMHSDGLVSRWKLDGYPGLQLHHPTVIAATLYRDFRRERDDVTVIGARS